MDGISLQRLFPQAPVVQPLRDQVHAGVQFSDGFGRKRPAARRREAFNLSIAVLRHRSFGQNRVPVCQPNRPEKIQCCAILALRSVGAVRVNGCAEQSNSFDVQIKALQGLIILAKP
jgi:hypothetical protein